MNTNAIDEIFISYTSEDGKIADELKSIFETYCDDRISLYVAHKDTMAGDEWQKKIQEKLNSSF